MPELAVVYPRIDDATTLVGSEIEVAETEAEAFQSFRARLRRLEPTATASVGGGGSLAAATSVAGVEPAAVRAAYRDTVMAMGHYERDYDEPLLENVGVEFGAGVRGLLSHEVPLPPVQQGVVDAGAERVVEERTQFHRALEAERDSLESVAERLGEVERALHDLHVTQASSNRTERLHGLAADCQSLAAERQRSIHPRPTPRISGIDEKSLVAYLYGEADHRFPALVEVTEVAARVESALDR